MPNKEVFEYRANNPLYASAWSNRKDRPFRLAVGTFMEEYSNKVRIIQLNEQSERFEDVLSFPHPYPPTKIMWHPPSTSPVKDLLATSGDYLRIWEVDSTQQQAKMQCMLTANKYSEFCAPLTSFDWNELSPNIIGTSSIDTTCTIWDLEKKAPLHQLIAHDKEVYDIAFSSKDPQKFASVGGDGSLRMFDLRNLDESTVMYESDGLKPLLRLCWNRMDDNYLAVLPIESNKVIIIDTRYPSMPAAELTGHHSVVNSIAWAPHSSCHICTAGDDWQALIWDLQALPEPVQEPILAYTAEGEVNQLQWSAVQSDWVSIVFNDRLQTLRV